MKPLYTTAPSHANLGLLDQDVHGVGWRNEQQALGFQFPPESFREGPVAEPVLENPGSDVQPS